MDIPDYISSDEVRRVCAQLGIRDWTKLTVAEVEMEEAQAIQAAVGAEALTLSAEEFKHGLQIELEHGIKFPDANVTNNHPLVTGKIVLAHLKETLDYYTRLEVVELEGDVLKALLASDKDVLLAKYGKLLEARAVLSHREWSQAQGK